MSEYVRVTTPPGVLSWCIISGKGSKNYNEDGFEYKATITLKGKDAQAMIDQLNEIYGNDPKLSKRSAGYKAVIWENGKSKEVDPSEVGKNHDEFSFMFKSSTELLDKKTGEMRPVTIAVYDSALNRINLKDGIGNGSIGCISAAVRKGKTKNECWLEKYLNAVQIIDYVPYSPDSGFSKQTTGYVHQNEEGFQAQSDTSIKNESGQSNQKEKARPRL